MSKRGEEQDDGPKIEMIVDRQVEGLRRWMVMVRDLSARYDYPIPGRVKAFLAWHDHEFSDAGPGAEEGGVENRKVQP